MELSVIKKPELVVAIDVGSTYSGYAWQWRTDFMGNKQNVEFNTNWGLGAPQVHKTNTAILLKDDTASKYGLRICAFGYRAEQHYANIYSDDQKMEKEAYHLFKQFKTLLYRLTKPEGEPMVEDRNGMRFKLSVVMALFIRALIEDLHAKQPNTKKIENVLWVLTVPAIWSEQAKQFMRIAAQEAGIKRQHLLLASEPEAAAIYCLNLPNEQLAVMNNIRKPGHCFLTVDIGGGTTDLSAVQVQDNLQLKEICAERGHCIGGQSVNDAFFQACNDNFKGTEWSKKFMEASPFELMTMEHEFEKGKIAIGTEEMDESIQLQLPRSIRDCIKTGTIKVDKKQATVKITKEENLRFETSFVRDQLFDEACKIINSVIKGVLDKQKEIETVVIVGGFAQSTIVQETIKTFLKKKHPNVTVVVPTSPFRAVLMGAIFYGHDGLIFRSRISRATYGVEIDVRFDGKKHDVRKKWLNGKSGVYYCKHVFDTHVRKGQSVVLGEQTPGKYYMPIYETRSKIRFSLFETTQVPQDGKVMYTTDEGCKKVGEISVDLPDTHESTQKRKVSVQMIYGGTQLSVIATDVTTGKEYDTEINFNV